MRNLAGSPCRVSVANRNDSPRRSRLASENGKATPTRNEKDGWIMSWTEHPRHSTCDWWNASNCHVGLSGNAFATLASSRTSAIIRSMTAPR